MALFHEDKVYGIKIRESANDGSDFSNPDADYRLAFLGEDGKWHVKDSSGTVTDPFGSSGLANNLIVGTSMPPVPYSALTEKTLVANRVHYQRWLCLSSVTVSTVYFYVNVQNGNLDIGIYNAALDTKLGSTGSFACPATGNRSQALTGSVNLVAGTIYYFAHATSSATFNTNVLTIGPTGLAMATGGWNTLGQQNSTFPLPATPSVTWEATTNWPIYHFK